MTAPAAPPGARPPAGLESAIGRLLAGGALVGVALLLVGVALMIALGISPTQGDAPGFDAGRLVADLTAGRPEGFLWTGIAILVATPVARVVGELVAFAYRRDRLMAGIAAAILGIIVLGVILGSIPEA